jgi:3-hydroxyisobutyrate dehydrogenase-like beta-hydroxyacid dehydrogenase
VARNGGAAAATPAAAAADATAVFVCVGNDDDVRAVTTASDGALLGMRAGAVLVDHTTTSATLARELAAAARARGVGFVDAPVSGGQVGAEKGTLTVMCGGEAADFAPVEPLIASYAHGETLGPVRSASSQNGESDLHRRPGRGACRGAALRPPRRYRSERAVIAVVSKGAAQSWQMENRAESMLAGRFDFGFAVDWMRKDLGFALDEGRRNGASLPVTALVDQLYAEVQALGGGRWDTSSLIQRLCPAQPS